MYKLFLDNERNPDYWMFRADRDVCEQERSAWHVVRTYEDAVLLVLIKGCPTSMSLDYNLGKGNKTGLDFLKWFTDYDAEHNIIPEGFEYYIHSSNPTGRPLMQNYMHRYMQHKFKDYKPVNTSYGHVINAYAGEGLWDEW